MMTSIVQKGGKNLRNKILLILVGCFFLALFANSFYSIATGNNFNPEGDTLGTRFYLVGPDSYYNMRTCEQIMESGYYPVGEDKLLNHPVGQKGARPPVFTMIATSITNLLGGSTDALGWVMLLLPAIYGALLVFPVYYLGKELFSESVAIMSAIFVPLTPILMGYRKGSALGLFDHDCFIILLMLLMMLFYLRAINTEGKKSLYNICITGVILGAIHLSWVSSQIIFYTLVIFLIVKLFIDVYTENYDDTMYVKTMIAFVIAFCIISPYSISLINNTVGFTLLIIFVIFIIYTAISKIEIRKQASLFLLSLGGIGGIVFLYLVELFDMGLGVIGSLANVLFGTGVYSSKLFATISEGQVSSLSSIIIGIGPVIFWFAFGGFVIYLYEKGFDKRTIFVSTCFVVCLWLVTTAGRFVVILAPLMILFGVYLADKFVIALKNKKVLAGVVAVLIFVPSFVVVADQSVNPYEMEIEKQWSEVCNWLYQQDDNLAVLSWWDYGFYIISMSKHPVVADNFQSGVPTASSFFTASTEKEVLATLIIRIAEGVKEHEVSLSNPKGRLLNATRELLEERAGSDLVNILEDPVQYAPSYNQIICPEWNNTVMRVSSFNAMYQDAVDILVEVDVNQLYQDMIDVTGFEIGYLIVSERDMELLYPIITYLADRGVWYYTLEDDYYVGLNATKKGGYYDTVVYKIYTNQDLEYFDYVYDENGIKIVKYNGGE